MHLLMSKLKYQYDLTVISCYDIDIISKMVLIRRNYKHILNVSIAFIERKVANIRFTKHCYSIYGYISIGDL